MSQKPPFAAPLLIYQQIVDSSPDCIFVVGSNYKFTAVNDTFLRHTGLARGQIVGKHLADIMGQAVFDMELRPRLGRCLSGEAISSREWFEYGASGRYYVEATYYPCRDDANRVIGAVVVGRDFTQQQLAQEAALEREAKLATLIENTADRVWAVDSQYRLIISNRAFQRQMVSLFGRQIERGDLVFPDQVPEQMRGRVVWLF